MRSVVRTSFIWTNFANIFSIISRLLITSILARMVSPDDFGYMTSFLILISFGEILGTFGLGQALIQKNIISDDDTKTAFITNIFLGVLFFAIAHFLQNPITFLLGIEYDFIYFAISFTFIIHGISSTSLATLQRNMRFKRISIIEMTANVAYGILTIVLANFIPNYFSLFWGYLFQISLTTVLLFLSSPIKRKGRFCFKALRELISFGFGHTIAKIINNIGIQGDNFIVNRSLGKEQLGIYSKSYQLFMYPVNIIGASIEKLFFPIFSRTKNNGEQMFKDYTSVIFTACFFTLPIIGIIFLEANHIILILYGSNWEAAVIPFQILILSLFFRISTKISDAVIKAYGNIYKKILIQILFAATIVSFSLIGVAYELIGVSIGVLLSMVLNFFIMIIFSYRIQKKPWIKTLSLIIFFYLINLITIITLTLIKANSFAVSPHLVDGIVVGLYILLYSLEFRFIFIKIVNKSIVSRIRDFINVFSPPNKKMKKIFDSILNLLFGKEAITD